jgi:hypothetical protein
MESSTCDARRGSQLASSGSKSPDARTDTRASSRHGSMRFNGSQPASFNSSTRSPHHGARHSHVIDDDEVELCDEKAEAAGVAPVRLRLPPAARHPADVVVLRLS